MFLILLKYPKFIKNLQNSTPKKKKKAIKKWAKDLNRHLSKNHIQMANRHEKMLNIANHQGNAN